LPQHSVRCSGSSGEWLCEKTAKERRPPAIPSRMKTEPLRCRATREVSPAMPVVAASPRARSRQMPNLCRESRYARSMPRPQLEFRHRQRRFSSHGRGEVINGRYRDVRTSELRAPREQALARRPPLPRTASSRSVARPRAASLVRLLPRPLRSNASAVHVT